MPSVKKTKKQFPPFNLKKQGFCKQKSHKKQRTYAIFLQTAAKKKHNFGIPKLHLIGSQNSCLKNKFLQNAIAVFMLKRH